MVTVRMFWLAVAVLLLLLSLRQAAQWSHQAQISSAIGNFLSSLEVRTYKSCELVCTYAFYENEWPRSISFAFFDVESMW